MTMTNALTDAELKAKLTPEQYHVTQEKGTEAPFSGEYLKVDGAGTFACVCCNAPLFTTTGKYESGCGWPSFWQAIDDKAIATAPDPSIPGRPRTEILCSQCGAHLGHVFDDGPQPTGQRYCVNSLSLTFDADADK